MGTGTGEGEDVPGEGSVGLSTGETGTGTGTVGETPGVGVGDEGVGTEGENVGEMVGDTSAWAGGARQASGRESGAARICACTAVPSAAAGQAHMVRAAAAKGVAGLAMAAVGCRPAAAAG